MKALDLAFYKGRSRYHTRYGTTPYTTGGEKSLWSMMEVAKGFGIELLNTYDNEVDQGGVRDRDAPVFFYCKHNVVSFKTRWVPSCSCSNFQCSNRSCLCFQLSICWHSISSSLIWSNHTRHASLWKRIIIARRREIVSLPRSRAPHIRFFSLDPQSPDSRRWGANGVSSSVPQSRTDRRACIDIGCSNR